MRALRLHGDRDLRLEAIDAPPPPGEGEVQLRLRAVSLNHIDVWGWRGMAFAQRTLPLAVGAEAAGEVVAVGAGVTGWKPGDRAVPYGARTCGHCAACREGRDNFCENVAGVAGFHIDGFAREQANVPARLLVRVPDGVSFEEAACATVTFGTVQHMLFDNAQLKPGETILIQAAGSGIGSVAIRVAKALGCTVIATAGDDEKCARAQALGADHVVNYTEKNFSTVARRVTGKRGVDVVFEHVGATTWAGSLLSLRTGGRLVTCGSTSGVSAETNLMMIFQRQLRIFGSFGCAIRNVSDALEKMSQGILPVLDTVVPLDRFAEGLERLESRRVFGKIVVTL
ncbi:zinc-binding dehydrogenase [Falsiroseomonas selenitidurans]|uniref:Zinc-binding dehydrogenase n=1 Tax=Falsiroseomonas selenitidurans TaxID=2716335 RepID=A0ABX1EDK7_9PROT|nr:zinc-binding dehydrogenase [Falsiroseomonas selenitidurans]NKC33987.1 zinc-binding dehydrogenase [Falsiroseomonas selenitidurans]